MRVQAQSRFIPNVFNVGNVVKRLIWTRMAEYNLTATPIKLPPEVDDRVQPCKRRTHHLRFV